MAAGSDEGGGNWHCWRRNTLAGVGAFVIPSVVNILANVNTANAVLPVIFFYADVLFVLGAALVMGLLLHSANLLTRQNLWLPVRFNRLNLFVFCFIAFQLLDIHTGVYVHLDDTTGRPPTRFAFGLVRRIFITLVFIALLPYTYHIEHQREEETHDEPTHSSLAHAHAQHGGADSSAADDDGMERRLDVDDRQRSSPSGADSSSTRESFLASIMCGFGLSETLHMLLLPTVAPQAFADLESHTRSSSIWLNFGLIRPMAIVYIFDSSVAIAHGHRNAPRILVKPLLHKGNVPDNNPSMGVALLGVVYFSLNLFGHYGISLPLGYTAGFAMAESLMALGVLTWVLLRFIRPFRAHFGLLPLRMFDRFSVVLLQGICGLIAATTTWIAIIDSSVSVRIAGLFSEGVHWFQALFALQMVDALLHVVLLIILYNTATTERHCLAHNVLYIFTCMLILHNLSLWVLNTNYELGIRDTLTQESARIITALWPLVVEFRILCVILLLDSIVHRAGTCTGFFAAAASSSEPTDGAGAGDGALQETLHVPLLAEGVAQDWAAEGEPAAAGDAAAGRDGNMQSQDSRVEGVGAPEHTKSGVSETSFHGGSEVDQEQQADHEGGFWFMREGKPTLDFVYRHPKPWFWVAALLGLGLVAAVTLPSSGAPPLLPSQNSSFFLLLEACEDFELSQSEASGGAHGEHGQDQEAEGHLSDHDSDHDSGSGNHSSTLPHHNTTANDHNHDHHAHGDGNHEGINAREPSQAKLADLSPSSPTELAFAILRLVLHVSMLLLMLSMVHGICRFAVVQNTATSGFLSQGQHQRLRGNAGAAVLFRGITRIREAWEGLKRVLAVPVRLRVLYLCVAGAFAYRADAAAFLVSERAWPSSPRARVHRVLSATVFFLDLLLLLATTTYALFVTQTSAQLQGEAYLRVKYSHTTRQWLQRYLMAGFFLGLGLLELFMSTYNGFGVLVHTQAVIPHHRFLFMGVLRLMYVISTFQLALMLLPLKPHPPMTSVTMRLHTIQQAHARTAGNSSDCAPGADAEQDNSTDRGGGADGNGCPDHHEGDGSCNGGASTAAAAAREAARAAAAAIGERSSAPSTGGRRVTMFRAVQSGSEGGFFEVEVEERDDGKPPSVRRVADGLGLVPIAVLVPAAVLAGYILAVQYGACKSSMYYAVAWSLVSLLNAGMALVLLLRWLGPSPAGKLRQQLSLLHARTFSFSVSVWLVLACVLAAWVTSFLFVHRDSAAPHLVIAEVLQQVDVTLAAVVCMATHAKRRAPDQREHRKWVQLCSNRAFTMMLLLTFSQLAIAFANIDNFVRINGPGFVHTRLPSVDQWALGLYPSFFLSRLGTGLLLARSCIATH